MVVKATREGLVGFKTSSGYVIDKIVPFCALPAEKALGRFVSIRNPNTGLRCDAIVLDVGPHHIDDDNYVFHGARPQAESDPNSNGAGIDLSEKTWQTLGMLDNGPVDWVFIQ